MIGGRAAGGLGVACLLLAACVSVDPTPTGAAAAPAAPEAGPAAAAPGHPAGRRANPWAEPARDVLVQHCGRCHRSDLDTSITRALAVFDLTEPVWYAHLAADQYDGILERIRENSGVPPEDGAAIEAFVGCAKGDPCPDPPQ